MDNIITSQAQLISQTETQLTPQTHPHSPKQVKTTVRSEEVNKNSSYYNGHPAYTHVPEPPEDQGFVLINRASLGIASLIVIGLWWATSPGVTKRQAAEHLLPAKTLVKPHTPVKDLSIWVTSLPRVSVR